MELKNLLDDQNWENSDFSYQKEAIAREMRSDVELEIKKLFSYYYKSLLLNSAFLLLLVSLYAVRPVADILLPIGIIGSTFLYLIITVVWQLYKYRQPDRSQDLLTMLREALAFHQRVARQQCAHLAWILNGAFAGGLLLGYIVQGRTLQQIAGDPRILSITLVLMVGCYFLTRSGFIRKLNRRINPGYVKTRKYLEEQLALLER